MDKNIITFVPRGVARPVVSIEQDTIHISADYKPPQLSPTPHNMALYDRYVPPAPRDYSISPNYERNLWWLMVSCTALAFIIGVAVAMLAHGLWGTDAMATCMQTMSSDTCAYTFR